MTIEEKIQAVGDYFIEKAEKGDYEFLFCDDNVAYIRFDSKYEFRLWIASGYNYFEFFDTIIPEQNALGFKTNAQKRKVWNKMRPMMRLYKKNILIKEKELAVEKLKKEIKNIERQK